MATLCRAFVTAASPAEAWEAVRDVGALHTRLAVGFVANTTLEPGARVVTFVNGTIVHEPIVTIDDGARRLVWSAESGRATHYNAALQVSDAPSGARLVWTIDFLPDSFEPQLAALMEHGIQAMKRTLDTAS
jgi:hypothetical protein